jgi:AraC-like DNA-binding protein
MLQDLPARWRRKANELRPYASAAAQAFDDAAEEMEAELRATGEQRLTLEQAAAESGYSRRHLRRLLLDGTLPNASVAGDETTILRKHLPKKPGSALARPNGSDVLSSPRQIVRAALTEGARHGGTP